MSRKRKRGRKSGGYRGVVCSGVLIAVFAAAYDKGELDMPALSLPGGDQLTSAMSFDGSSESEPSGDVDSWIDQAFTILQANGTHVSEGDKPLVATMIQQESGGDPQAVNTWDSNAAKGTPSKGLMQCIGPTFESYSLPGHGDIFDPVDNIIAGVRYALARYGSLSSVPGIESMSGGGAYQGY